MPEVVIAGGLTTELANTVLSGSLLAAIPIALLAGLVSFASPCVVPLVPGYLGYLSSMAGATSGRSSRPRLVLGVSLFVLGFSAVFVTLGVAFASFGAAVAPRLELITRILGVLVIVMGFVFIGSVPFLQREARVHVSPRAGLWGAPLLGAAFGFGWAPCIGPTLAAVMILALGEATVAKGTILAIAYSVGLGLPFIALALVMERSRKILGWMRRHRLALMRIGGGLLIVVGLLLVTGLWGQLTAWMQQWVDGFWVAI